MGGNGGEKKKPNISYKKKRGMTLPEEGFKKRGEEKGPTECPSTGGKETGNPPSQALKKKRYKGEHVNTLIPIPP